MSEKRYNSKTNNSSSHSNETTLLVVDLRGIYKISGEGLDHCFDALLISHCMQLLHQLLYLQNTLLPLYIVWEISVGSLGNVGITHPLPWEEQRKLNYIVVGGVVRKNKQKKFTKKIKRRELTKKTNELCDCLYVGY